jgi:hypothetical protein
VERVTLWIQTQNPRLRIFENTWLSAKKNNKYRYANNMQGFISDLLKKHGFAVFLNVLGLAGLMANLYLASKLYPLADTDKRLEYRIDAVQAQVAANEQLTNTQFEYIKRELGDIKGLVRDKRN